MSNFRNICIFIVFSTSISPNTIRNSFSLLPPTCPYVQLLVIPDSCGVMAKSRKTHISTSHNKGETHDLTWSGLFLSVFYPTVMGAAVPVILSVVGTAWFSTVTIWVSGCISVCVVLCVTNLCATRLMRTVLMGAVFVSQQGNMQLGIMTSAWTE